MDQSALYRALPSMDGVLERLEQEADLAVLPRPLVRDLANGFFDGLRQAIQAGDVAGPGELSLDAVLPKLLAFVRQGAKPHFRRVLNATGVVIHTNMGRSLLAGEAVEAVREACGHYSNLEFDLGTGKRGSRYSLVEDILCQVSGAEAALVVNNNAAAVLLVLDTLAKGMEVVVSRGELVEIGGSFRIPEVMAKSGATLREVGATNRTHLRDYEAAINDRTAALMKVHTSNYRIVGFSKSVSLPDMVELGRRYGLAVIEDLGSGNFYNFAGLGLDSEPTVQDTVASGVDVATFSGDKVLGGPQAGVIVGRREYIERIKANPMNRALRIDKMTLAGLEATLRLYLDPDQARKRVPTLRMITATAEELASKARSLARRIKRDLGDRLTIQVKKGVSRVGGGSFPENDLETSLVRITPPPGLGLDVLKERLLATDPPLVGRVEDDALCLDPRTLDSKEFALAASALAQALGG